MALADSYIALRPTPRLAHLLGCRVVDDRGSYQGCAIGYKIGLLGQIQRLAGPPVIIVSISATRISFTPSHDILLEVGTFGPGDLGKTLLGNLSFVRNLPSPPLSKRTCPPLIGKLSLSSPLLRRGFRIEQRCEGPLRPFHIPACRLNYDSFENGTPFCLTFTYRPGVVRTDPSSAVEATSSYPDSDPQFLSTNQ